MNEFSAPLSRNEAILQNILGANNALEPAHSRVEAILLSILNDTPYTDEPISRIEKILLAIKNGTEYTDPPRSRNEEILLCKLHGEEYTEPPRSRIEELLIAWASAARPEETTVTGNAPVALENAVVAAIISLIQEGKVTQDLTPTPSAPADIVCNNGVLRMVDDELPLGYKRLTGIKFDGDFHYETGESLTGDDDVTMTLANTASQGQNVFGSYNGTASGSKNFSLFIYGNGSTSNSYFRYGDQLLRPRFGTGERTITIGKSGTDGFLTDVSATPDTFTTPANAYIGMLPNSSSPPYTGDIVGSILGGNRLEWIPCESDGGVIGYYEKYKGNFIAPSGTGTPTSLGYDYSNAHLAVVGTPEVLSVTASGAATQTASVPDLFAVGDYADEVNIISGGVTHKVGIKILTGEETTWALSDSGTTHRFRGVKPRDCYTPASRAPSICTHFKYVSTGSAVGGMFIGASQYWYFIPTDQTMDTVEAWRAWLAEQYAAGTPVIVLYPLAEETTESVTAQPLTTAAGDNVVSVTSNVDPVFLTVEYYKEAEE